MKLLKVARKNTLLQKWNILMKRTKAKHLRRDTVRMMIAVRKYNVTFASLNISSALRAQLLTWQHIGIEKEIPLNPRANCILNNHNLSLVKDLLKLANRLKNMHLEGTHHLVYTY